MELTYTSRKLLKQLREITSSENDILAFVDGTPLVRNEATSAQIDLSVFPGFFGIIDYLVRQGALSYPYQNAYYVSFTHEGLHPHQVSWERAKKFIFESVLVPIFVAFVTTILTLLVRGL